MWHHFCKRGHSGSRGRGARGASVQRAEACGRDWQASYAAAAAAAAAAAWTSGSLGAARVRVLWPSSLPVTLELSPGSKSKPERAWDRNCKRSYETAQVCGIRSMPHARALFHTELYSCNPNRCGEFLHEVARPSRAPPHAKPRWPRSRPKCFFVASIGKRLEEVSPTAKVF